MGRFRFGKKCKSRKSGAGNRRPALGDKEPRHRASPCRIVSLYPHLTPEQRKLIDDAGFGGLLQIRCPTFPMGLCGWLLQRFDTDNCELVIDGRGRIPITIDSVHRMLGIPNSGGDVKYAMDADATAFMAGKYGYPADGYSPTIKSMENSLKQMKNADEHFLRTFMVLVVSSFLCPTTSMRISPRCFPSLVDIGSVRELNWCKFVVEQLKKFASAYGKKSSVPGCLFYLVILYLDSLDTGNTQIPGGTPRVSAWSKRLVHKVIRMDLKNNGSFGKCMLKKTPDANINPTDVSTASAMLGGVPEIANFVASNVSPGYSEQKKEVLCNAVGKLCATITNALSKFMHEISGLEGSSGEASRDSKHLSVGGNNVEKNGAQRDEDDTLPEDSSELPTEDTEDTSSDESGDESSPDGGSTSESEEDHGGSSDDSEEDPDWEEEQFNSSKQKPGKTERANGPSKFEQGTIEGSSHDSDTPKESQGTKHLCSEQPQENLVKRAWPVGGGCASQVRSTRRKTGEDRGAIVEKTVVQPTSSSLHVGKRPSSSNLVLFGDMRPLKIEEDIGLTHIVNLCTSTSSES